MFKIILKPIILVLVFSFFSQISYVNASPVTPDDLIQIKKIAPINTPDNLIVSPKKAPILPDELNFTSTNNTQKTLPVTPDDVVPMKINEQENITIPFIEENEIPVTKNKNYTKFSINSKYTFLIFLGLIIIFSIVIKKRRRL